MVDRRLRNCPLCGEQNATFMYRTDVGSGQTIATRCTIYCDERDNSKSFLIVLL